MTRSAGGRTSEPLITCTDGPYTGMWFTTDDWQARITAARRMLDAGQRRGPALDYTVDATATVPHPTQDALGQAARYQTGVLRTGNAA